jgi:N,N'-diacetylchitobiose transport system permease protein
MNMSTPRISRNSGPYLLIVPTVLVLVVAMGYPLGRQLILSFQEFGRAQQFGQPAEWVGLQNYQDLVTDKAMWTVIIRSLIFCAVCASVTMVIGTLFALLMKRVGTAPRLVLQISMLLTWAMPVIAAMTAWQWLFDTRYGLINWALRHLGFSSFENHNWLIEPMSFFFVAGVIVIWMSVPFVAFTSYAALTQVSEETLEASHLDGATPLQRFRHIIFPTIKPVLTIVMLLQVVWDLRVFAQIDFLQKVGGTVSQTHLMGTYIYTLGIGQSDYGSASALSMFVLVLTLALTYRYVRRLLAEDAA